MASQPPTKDGNNMVTLSSLKHAPRTDLAAGRINNQDAALLALFRAGGEARSRDLKRALQEWRGSDLRYVYLFNANRGPGYGFTGSSADSVIGRLQFVQPRRTFWFRSGRGTYRITNEGLKRIAELNVLAS